jgi:two-component system, cell cycle sensor histidine kinase and response regulator CckA
VKLVVDLPDAGPIIQANAKQIRQVLNQLLANAAEAIGPDPGEIRLRVAVVDSAQIPATHRFPLDWTPTNTPYACLEVADTGCGIPKKDIETMFDPFFTTKFTGRGMGLPVVLGLLRAQNGGATVDSQAGQGTILRVFFPLAGDE